MSKKKIITIVSVLAVMLLSASVISYSIANRGNGGKNEIDTELTKRGASVESDYTTNIDLIIQNSNKSPGAEYYNVVEIIPSAASPSDLGTYISTGSFREYVINENSATNPKGSMKSGMIRMDTIKVTASTSLDDIMNSTIMSGSATIREVLDETDLIYMSSPTYTAFEGNMSEDIYNYLHTYVLGKNKPMILDYVTANNSGGNVADNKKYVDLVKAISNNHIRFRTFSWLKDTTAMEFFNHNTKKGSYYVTYNVTQTPANGKVLVITSNKDAADTMYHKMVTEDDGASQNLLMISAYFGSGRPKEWDYTFKTPNGITEADLATDYDFILLEHDIMTQNIPAAVYTKLKTLSESAKYIFYDNRESSSGGSGSTTIPPNNNYLKLMELLVSNTGVARYGHVLAISYGYFTSLKNAGASGKEGAKAIADIINSGDYRGSGSSGANGKVFRVLELQPCYPIDMDMALANKNGGGSQYKYGITGNYYVHPSQVMSGVTKDEIEADVEYYDFDLSRAKIAYATGLNYNQVRVDQMSTTEYMSKKDITLETYDLIYIGGNTSALIPGENKMLLGDTLNPSDTKRALEVLTSFDMFTHTGQLVTLRTGVTYNDTIKQKVKNTPGQSTDDAPGTIYINNVKKPTVVEYNGNDISNIKYQELADYVKKGMPIIIEKQVADAFEESKKVEDNRLKQLALRQIDPDSWMYKALDKVYTASKAGSTSVVWGLDAVNNQEVQQQGNVNRNYGNTLGAALTVFKTDVNDKIAAVINASSVRPTLVVTSAPKEYSEGNASSYNKVADGFTVKAYAKPATSKGGNKFELSLYIDVDGNGVFSEGSINADGECVQTKSYTYKVNGEDEDAEPATESLKYTLEPEFYGILSWKVVAKDTDTGLVSSVTGYAYYEREEDVAKKEIDILQIMPWPDSKKNTIKNAEANNEVAGYMYNSGESLYLCTECQMSFYRAKYNLWDNSGGGNSLGQFTVGTQHQKSGVNLGLHEHKFGIVQFNSATRYEDWESNLAEVLTGPDGDYTVDMDIMYADEFEDLVAEVKALSEEEIEANKEMMMEAYSEWQNAEEDPDFIAAEEALSEYLKSMSGAGLKKSELFEQFANDREYYKVWLYNINGVNIDFNTELSTYRTLYNTYIEYKDKALEAKQRYREYRRLAYASDQWLAMNYSIVVLGFAEDFGGEDMNKEACEMIADYVNRGGSMLNTHDSTTKFEKAGAMNITTNLRGIFGMDRYHVTGVAEGSGGTGKAEAAETTATLRIGSRPYTSPVETADDATYVVQIQCQNLVEIGRFTIAANQPKQVDINAYLQVNGDLMNSWTGLYGGSTCIINNTASVAKTTVNVDVKWWTDANGNGIWQGNEGDAKPVPSGMDIKVLKVTRNEWGGEALTQITTKKTTGGGIVSFELDQAMKTVTPSKYTKEFSDGTTIVMKNADRTFNVSLVDTNDSANNTITAGVVGTEYDDLTKDLIVTIQVTLPAGAEPKYLSGIPVTLIHNASVNTSTTNDQGIARFTVSQISTLAGGNISADSLQYRHFTTADASMYFFTERAVTADYVQWNKDMIATGFNLPNVKQVWPSFGYNSPVGLTDAYMMNTTAQNAPPYRYVEYDQNGIQWDMGYPSLNSDKVGYGPNGASQVNKGIVTTYPFLISSELRISTTHTQTYALDMEDKDVAVWYALSAGTDGTKVGASYYAADPHDGMNNYYLYSKGNVFYCGAGHSVITGPGRDNNDERRLFINVIVNSVRNAKANPKITVHRKDTDGAEVKEDKNEKLNVDKNGDYYYNVDETDETPEFDFKVRVDSKADLAEVYVFYDLDYMITDKTDSYKNDAKHILIAQYNTKAEESKALVSAELAKLREYKDDAEDGNPNGYKNLKLKQAYFDVYGGYYTYIVIQATDTNGKTAYQRIKINLIPKLWDLTMTEQRDDQVSLDLYDKIQYVS